MLVATTHWFPSTLGEGGGREEGRREEGGREERGRRKEEGRGHRKREINITP